MVRSCCSNNEENLEECEGGEMNTKVVPTMHQWQAARDMFDSRGCTHWGSVRLIIEAFLAAAPSLEEREGDEQMNETKVVPVDAAFDALNRMQSIMMMDDGQHPRNVLRDFINAAAPNAAGQEMTGEGPKGDTVA